MSNSYNTDGMMTYPATGDSPITQNALESIECAIAFDVRDWSTDRRSAWIYAIVFGRDDGAWQEMAKYHGWDDEDRKRAAIFHAQWTFAKAQIDFSNSIGEWK